MAFWHCTLRTLQGKKGLLFGAQFFFTVKPHFPKLGDLGGILSY